MHLLLAFSVALTPSAAVIVKPPVVKTRQMPPVEGAGSGRASGENSSLCRFSC